MIKTTLEKLEELGIRKEGKFKLSSGAKSNVFWDVEELFRYPLWIRNRAIEDFIWEIGALNPDLLIGIPTGGLLLAKDIAKHLEVAYTSIDARIKATKKSIVIDDVLTTGGTIRKALKDVVDPMCIAVLVVRSGRFINNIDDIPLICGCRGSDV